MQDPIFRQRVIEGKTDESIHRYLPILRTWNALHEVITFDRARSGPGVWDGFEIQAKGTVRYYRQMNPNFPGAYLSDDKV
jgi:hypothetical protein